MITKRKLQLRRARRTFWRKQAAQFVAKNLTTRGTTPVYRKYPDLAGMHGGRRKAERQRLMRLRLREQGFTCRRTPIRDRATTVERMWLNWKSALQTS